MVSTTASEMYNSSQVPVEEIRDFLGHSDIKTTWEYIVNTRDEEESKKRMHRSLQGLNGLTIIDEQIA